MSKSVNISSAFNFRRFDKNGDEIKMASIRVTPNIQKSPVDTPSFKRGDEVYHNHTIFSDGYVLIEAHVPKTLEDGVWSEESVRQFFEFPSVQSAKKAGWNT